MNAVMVFGGVLLAVATASASNPWLNYGGMALGCVIAAVGLFRERGKLF